jgi:hypothetical protein
MNSTYKDYQGKPDPYHQFRILFSSFEKDTHSRPHRRQASAGDIYERYPEHCIVGLCGGEFSPETGIGSPHVNGLVLGVIEAIPLLPYGIFVNELTVVEGLDGGDEIRFGTREEAMRFRERLAATILPPKGDAAPYKTAEDLLKEGMDKDIKRYSK